MAEEWPGELRRHPPRSSPTYALRKPLADWIESEARAFGSGYRVLDVGCGVKPYYPFFEPYAADYVGVDLDGAADLVGRVEALPVEDGSFDVVLCTQVLEHCDDPAQAVRELRRVLAPGGRVLASTHGVQVYHPAPKDLWRWTHEGLEALFLTNAQWSAVTVRPASGSAACLGLLLSIYLDLASRRAHVPRAGRAAVTTVNRVAGAIDARSRRLRELGPGTIHANYHVRAEA